MDRDRLVELAERVEKTGADRELDELCALAAGYRLVEPDPNERLQGVKRWVDPDGIRNGWVHNPRSLDFPLAYTASLDAAMTLAEMVSKAWGRPANLCIAAFYGSAYIVPCDGASYGINDPLKGEALVAGEGISAERMARSVTAAALRALANGASHG